LGATTLLYKDNKFIMLGPFATLTTTDDLIKKEESYIDELLIGRLQARDGDVVIIGSDNKEIRTAEFGAKNAALFTIMNHDKHNIIF
jgi:hypothetical protein